MLLPVVTALFGSVSEAVSPSASVPLCETVSPFNPTTGSRDSVTSVHEASTATSPPVDTSSVFDPVASEIGSVTVSPSARTPEWDTVVPPTVTDGSSVAVTAVASIVHDGSGPVVVEASIELDPDERSPSDAEIVAVCPLVRIPVWATSSVPSPSRSRAGSSVAVRSVFVNSHDSEPPPL
ncbi:hypothetical protein [Halorubrum ezzemoulense]|uniref:hypothetical protein n=1 Tax=Halorubrum ezzemoulense TaxID=337243 RepID=UPI0011817BEF|nr:hypothetical protein [Halorubrum ezzemoulense]